jgi:high affinity Mn2+ porin
MRCAALFCLTAPLCLTALAQSDEPSTAAVPASDWAIHGDSTFIGQRHGAFTSTTPNGAAVPDGPNSFTSASEHSYSSVTGLNLGYALTPSTEAWIRVESIRGIPLSGAGGLAALTNNDMQRIMTSRFTTYVALGFVTHTWELGGAAQSIEADTHQFAQESTSRRVNISIGKMDLLGIFDDNAYAHKSDDQFLNWCFMTHCAYDFAADARGYTWGVASELDWDEWSTRAGWFAMPRLPNQLEIDASIGQHFGINWETERRWQSGSLKFLVYQGRMKLTDYGQYLNQTGVYVQDALKTDAKRGGAGLNLQQALTPDIGLFARVFWTGGHSESMAFTEADSSFSMGTVFDGKMWHRPLDGVGVGLARNEISQDRQAYLAAGNADLFIGGAIAGVAHSFIYSPEQVLEIYYRAGIVAGVHVTVDWQYIQNPAYNQDRGPVSVYGLRLHGEF